MSGKLEFKLVVTENGEEVLSKLLSYEAVSNIVSNASDNKDNEDLFTLAASHPASTVRENVAYKDHMPEAAVRFCLPTNQLEFCVIWFARKSSRNMQL